jgi:hypothetical protein
MTSLEKMEPDTDAIPALPMSCVVRSRLSRMIGRSGAAANVDTKHMQKESHDR